MPDLEVLQARVRVQHAQVLVRVPEVDVVDTQRTHVGEREQRRADVEGHVAPAERLEEEVVDRGVLDHLREEVDQLREPAVVGVLAPGAAQAAVEVQLADEGEDSVRAEHLEQEGELQVRLQVETVEAELAHCSTPFAIDECQGGQIPVSVALRQETHDKVIGSWQGGPVGVPWRHTENMGVS